MYVIPVLLVAVAVYVIVSAPWHLVDVAPIINTGVPTVGVTVTVRVTCEDGPLQPLAVTCMSTVPENPFAQVIIPVVAPMFPAEPLLRLQLNPVLFVAVVA
jgi:hypothetical protein